MLRERTAIGKRPRCHSRKTGIQALGEVACYWKGIKDLEAWYGRLGFLAGECGGGNLPRAETGESPAHLPRVGRLLGMGTDRKHAMTVV